MKSIISLLWTIKTMKISFAVIILILMKSKLLINLTIRVSLTILSLVHIKKYYFPKNIKDLENFRDKVKIDFDVIAISESKIMENRSPINYINLKNYSHMNRTQLSFS